MLVSLSNSTNASSSLTQSTTWVTSFTLDNWQSHSTPSTRFQSSSLGTNITGLRSFLVLCNVFRNFVPNFAYIAGPLNRKFRNNQLTHFEKPAENEILALKSLQQNLTTPPVLALPRSTGIYTLDTNSCDGQVC